MNFHSDDLPYFFYIVQYLQCEQDIVSQESERASRKLNTAERLILNNERDTAITVQAERAVTSHLIGKLQTQHNDKIESDTNALEALIRLKDAERAASEEKIVQLQSELTTAARRMNDMHSDFRVNMKSQQTDHRKVIQTMNENDKIEKAEYQAQLDGLMDEFYDGGAAIRKQDEATTKIQSLADLRLDIITKLKAKIQELRTSLERGWDRHCDRQEALAIDNKTLSMTCDVLRADVGKLQDYICEGESELMVCLSLWYTALLSTTSIHDCLLTCTSMLSSSCCLSLCNHI